MSKLHYTPSEIIALASKSKSPYLVVEGKTDARLLRWIEGHYQLGNVIVKCDGKQGVIDTFGLASRRQYRHVHCLVDSDLWIFDGKPQHLTDLVSTDGYSIENDILLRFPLKEYLGDEYKQYEGARDFYKSHYYDKVMKKRRGDDIDMSGSVCNFLEFKGEEVSEKICGPVIQCGCQIWDLINSNPEKAIRGKQLIEIIGKILNRPGRGTNFSHEAIKELLMKQTVLAGNTPPSIDAIVNKIRSG